MRAIYGSAIAVLIPHSGEDGLLALVVLAVTPLASRRRHQSQPELRHGDGRHRAAGSHRRRPRPSAGLAIDRVIEITVGALTGLAVSFLVLPSRAIGQIRVNAAPARADRRGIRSELLAGLTRGLDNDALHRIQDGIGAALTGLNATSAPRPNASARAAPFVGSRTPAHVCFTICVCAMMS